MLRQGAVTISVQHGAAWGKKELQITQEANETFSHCKAACQDDLRCNAIVGSPPDPKCIFEWGQLWLFVVGAAVAMLGPCIVDFVLSLKIAAKISAGDIKAITKSAEDFAEPHPEERGLLPRATIWRDKIEIPALSLDFRSSASARPRGSIGLLSSGWGSGLAWLYVLCWVGLTPTCVATVLLYILADPNFNDANAKMVEAFFGFLTVLVALLPLFFSLAPARISTACQGLLGQLNLVRMCDLEQHTRVEALETTLRNLNQQQGLGIVVGFTRFDLASIQVVVDMKLVKQGLGLVPSVVAWLYQFFLSQVHSIDKHG